MKKIVAFLVVVLFIPPLTAYAASVTSKSFVVRNWKATPASTTPDTITPLSTEEIETGELEEEPTIPPVDGQNAPAPNTPDFTDEAEPGEQSEQGDEEEPEDFTRGQIETDEDIGAVPPAFTTPAFTDEVEMGGEIEPEEHSEQSEGEPVGEEQGEMEEPQEMK